jgi:hypothetical protein
MVRAMKNRILLIPAALAVLAVAAPVATGAQSAAPRIADVDADLRFDGRVYLEAETAGATRVHFTYRGRTVKARRGALDREDGTRDWGRVVRARGGDASGGNTVEIKVRACSGGQCVTATRREHLEREDDD